MVAITTTTTNAVLRYLVRFLVLFGLVCLASLLFSRHHLFHCDVCSKIKTKPITVHDDDENYASRQQHNTTLFNIQNDTSLKNAGGERPLLLLHLGPYKTGTTTIQLLGANYSDILLRDNIYYQGDYGAAWKLGIANENKQQNPELRAVVKCEHSSHVPRHNCTAMLDLVRDQLEKQRALGRTVLVSDEMLRDAILKPGKAPLVRQFLLNYLPSKWNVRVLFSHRRHHERLVSGYDQGSHRIVNKDVGWPTDRSQEVKSLPEHLKRWEGHVSVGDPTQIQKLRKFFKHVRVFNLHKSSDSPLGTRFYCEMIPEARLLCQALREANDMTHANAADEKIPILFDQMAVGAFKRGWLNSTLYSRVAVRYYLFTHWNLSDIAGENKDCLPMDCLSDEEMTYVLDVSLDIERSNMPKFFASSQGESVLRAGFQEYVATRKFCSPNGDKLLDVDLRWEAYFKKTFGYSVF